MRGDALAVQTPNSRNRYVDFLRAVSIGAVVIGHWLMTAPWVADGEIHISTLLEHREWTHWLSWGFQVMPVFFLVGGYANGISWRSTLRSGKTYNVWLLARLQRLVSPVLPLLILWALLAVAADWLGVQPEMVQTISRIALIPLWFLAVYLVAVVLVPVTYAAWKRYGLCSFWVLALAAATDDTLVFVADLQAVSWFNYAFIWLAVHQLGYAWREGCLASPRKSLMWAAGGAIVLIALVTLGPYPVSMVGVPGQEVSNTQPPKLPILALGIVQCGLLLPFESPMRRWLKRTRPWKVTLRVNSMIMTIFLWHLTASTLIVGFAAWSGSTGLTADPGSGDWWVIRPLWLGVYTLALTPLALGFGRFERGHAGDQDMPAWRLVAGAALVCGGLALLAGDGIAGDGWLGLRITALLLPFAGAALAGINPLRR